ncbi:MAG TPA: trypsin-like peptidase domain-containing protein [Holophagaceae bacterium]|nr:trypsin-like peptidase domain-containing protein [Holophagaceae bacterium]
MAVPQKTLKQILGLSAFAGACLALGMGLSRTWVVQAQEEKPVTVESKASTGLPPIADVAEKLNPTVVYITNKSFVKNPHGTGNGMEGDPFFDFFFGPGGRQRRPRGGEEDEGQMVGSSGSGVVISADGEILTNYHVIEGWRGAKDPTLMVKMADGKEYAAKVLGRDKDLDIALLKIEASHLPYAKLGDSSGMRVGEWVVAIGNPLGLSHTVTAGIISAKGRSNAELGGGSPVQSFLQTDAAINRGNSGGPLLNLKGEVIGINTAIRADGQNIGFAVPVDSVKRILPDLKTGRPVSRGALGLQPQELNKEFQEALGAKEGVVVGDLTKGLPAEKAGIQQLDVITAVDGTPVKSPEDLISQISARRAGETVKLALLRNGKAMTIGVTLADRKSLAPKGEGEEEGGPAEEGRERGEGLDLMKAYGFKVEAINPGTRALYQLGEDREGVVVTKVDPRSVGAERNLQPGLVILKVGTQPVKNLQEFNAAVKKSGGKPLLLYVAPPRGDQRLTLAIPPR